MIEFSHWDIIRHLCKGGAWSAGLSLIAMEYIYSKDCHRDEAV
jgi:hypothetical protein